VTGAGGARYARGAQRRGALIEAAADLVLEHGLAALSHRAVAARAGLPLASTTYYFASAEDLRDEALRHNAQRWRTRAEAVVEALPAQLDTEQAARAVGGIIGTDMSHEQMLLMYERYLEAGRHPRLRPLVTSWNAHFRDLVRQVLFRAGLPSDEAHAGLVLAVADGAAVTALAEGAAPDVPVTAALTRVLSTL
jgi:DNA-binding transcriptional regulator YbjK